MRHTTLLAVKIALVAVFCFSTQLATVNGASTSNRDLAQCQHRSHLTWLHLVYHSWNCRNGLWPSQSEPDVVVFPGLASERDIAQILDFSNIVIHVNDFKPLPQLPLYSTRLSLTDIRSVTSDGKPARFPMPSFTAAMNRTAVASLTLDRVDLSPRLTEFDLEGFTGLVSLELTQCNMLEIDPRAFYPLAMTVTDDSGTIISYESNLASLEVQGPQPNEAPAFPNSLVSFPWDSLLPIAASIQSIMITSQPNLSAITYDGASTFNMSRLSQIDIWATGVSTLSQDILDTADNSETYFSITFIINPNKCGSCDLVPMVNWVNAGAKFNRILRATCMNDGTGARPWDELPPYIPDADNAAFWQTYPITDCKF